MDEYINRTIMLATINSAAKDGVLFSDWSTDAVVAFIKRQPTANVVPIRRGQWIPLWGGKGMQCEHCKKAVINHFDSVSRFEKEYWFCPNCGAEMEG